MDNRITLREGAEVVGELATPLVEPDAWFTRQEAAAHLDVGDRTIDRYIRTGLLTGYRGMVLGGGVGVRVLRFEVENWSDLHPATVDR